MTYVHEYVHNPIRTVKRYLALTVVSVYIPSRHLLVGIINIAYALTNAPNITLDNYCRLLPVLDARVIDIDILWCIVRWSVLQPPLYFQELG